PRFSCGSSMRSSCLAACSPCCGGYSRGCTRSARSSVFIFRLSPTPALYTLSLRDALPICEEVEPIVDAITPVPGGVGAVTGDGGDRERTPLDSSHGSSSHAVFCWEEENAWLRPR